MLDYVHLDHFKFNHWNDDDIPYLEVGIDYLDENDNILKNIELKTNDRQEILKIAHNLHPDLFLVKVRRFVPNRGFEIWENARTLVEYLLMVEKEDGVFVQDLLRALIDLYPDNIRIIK